jgi:hypothetical protein
MTRVAFILLIFAGGLSRALAQTPADAGVVVGVGGFSHIVANVEKSVDFYRDVAHNLGPRFCEFPDRSWASS